MRLATLTFRPVVPVEGSDGSRVEEFSLQVHVREAEREVGHGVGVLYLYVDFRVVVGFRLVDVDLGPAVAVRGTALDSEYLPRFELVLAACACSSQKRDANRTRLVRDVDVQDVAVLRVVPVAFEGPNVADARHLGNELHFLDAGFDVGDPVHLAFAQFVRDEHCGGFLVRKPAHLFDFFLDGVPELVQRDVGVEVPVYLVYNAHNRTRLQGWPSLKRCLCVGNRTEFADCDAIRSMQNSGSPFTDKPTLRA